MKGWCARSMRMSGASSVTRQDTRYVTDLALTASALVQGQERSFWVTEELGQADRHSGGATNRRKRRIAVLMGGGRGCCSVVPAARGNAQNYIRVLDQDPILPQSSGQCCSQTAGSRTAQSAPISPHHLQGKRAGCKGDEMSHQGSDEHAVRGGRARW